MERTYTQHLLRCPTGTREAAIRTNSHVAFDLKDTVVMDTVTGDVISRDQVAWNFRLVNPSTGEEV